MRCLLAFLIALSMSWSTTSSAHGFRFELRLGEMFTNRAHAKGYGAQDSLRPTTGRFLSLDPLAGSLSEPLSTQGFIYANSNPTRFTDPDGRMSDAGADRFNEAQRQIREGCRAGNDSDCELMKAQMTVGIAGLAAPASAFALVATTLRYAFMAWVGLSVATLKHDEPGGTVIPDPVSTIVQELGVTATKCVDGNGGACIQRRSG